MSMTNAQEGKTKDQVKTKHMSCLVSVGFSFQITLNSCGWSGQRAEDSGLKVEGRRLCQLGLAGLLRYCFHNRQMVFSSHHLIHITVTKILTRGPCTRRNDEECTHFLCMTGFPFS